MIFGSPAQPSENAFGYSRNPTRFRTTPFTVPHAVPSAQRQLEVPSWNIKLLQQCVEKSTAYRPSFVDARLKLFQTGGNVLKAWEAMLNRELKAAEKEFYRGLEGPSSARWGLDEMHVRALIPRFPSSLRTSSTPNQSGQAAIDPPPRLRASLVHLTADSGTPMVSQPGQRSVLTSAAHVVQQPSKSVSSSQVHERGPSHTSQSTQGLVQAAYRARQEFENDLVIHFTDIFPDKYPFSALPVASERLFQTTCTVHLLIEAPSPINDGPLKYLYQHAADGLIKAYRRQHDTCFVFDVAPFKVPIQRLRVATQDHEDSEDWHRAVPEKLNFYIGITFKGPADYESIVPHMRPGMTRQETRRPATLGAYIRMNVTEPIKTTKMPIWYHFGEDMPTEYAMWFEPRWTADFSETAPRSREVNSCPPELESVGVTSVDVKRAFEVPGRTASFFATSKMQDEAKKAGVLVETKRPGTFHATRASSKVSVNLDGSRQTLKPPHASSPNSRPLPKAAIRAGHEPTVEIAKSHAQSTESTSKKSDDEVKNSDLMVLDWPRTQLRSTLSGAAKYRSLASTFAFKKISSHHSALQQQNRERRAFYRQPQHLQRNDTAASVDPRPPLPTLRPLRAKGKVVVNLVWPPSVPANLRGTPVSYIEDLHEKTNAMYSLQRRAPGSTPNSSETASAPAANLREPVRNSSTAQGSGAVKETVQSGIPRSSTQTQSHNKDGNEDILASEQPQRVELFAVKTTTAQIDSNASQKSLGQHAASTANNGPLTRPSTTAPANSETGPGSSNTATVALPQQTPAATEASLRAPASIPQPQTDSAPVPQPARSGMPSSKSKRSGPTAHNSRFIRNLKRPPSPDLDQRGPKRHALFPLLNPNSPGHEKKAPEVSVRAQPQKTQTRKPNASTAPTSTPAPPELPGPLVRQKRKYPVPKPPPGVVFYRTASKRVLLPGELLSESDDEVDETALLDEHHALTDAELAHLPHAQRSLIKRLNAHLWTENVTHDAALHGALRRFVGAHGAWMLRKREPRRELFLAACERFRVWGALSRMQVAEVLALLDSVAGHEGETEGSSDEEPSARQKRKKATSDAADESDEAWPVVDW